MISVEKTIQNLFLIRNETEHESVIKLISLHGLTNFEMLTIKDDAPYLVNDCTNLEKVSTWQKYSILDPGFSRFWLNEYKSIEEIISIEMSKDKKYNNEIMQSPYFKFDLVQMFGKQYFEVIDILNNFFQKFTPDAICFRPESNFISNVILSFARTYRIKCWKLNL